MGLVQGLHAYSPHGILVPVMKPHPHKASGTHARLSKNNNRSLSATFGLTMLDTTWRIFVPVVLFVAVGLWIDLTTSGTRPWLTLSGLVLGLLVAATLVTRQIRGVRQ